MSIKREYQVYLYDNDQCIDGTCLDGEGGEHKDSLDDIREHAWHLFKEEFEHTNLSDKAYITVEPLGFYDTETGEDVIIEEVSKEKRIDPVDDMPQFKITYAHGEITQVEAIDIQEAQFHAEDFNNEKN